MSKKHTKRQLVEIIIEDIKDNLYESTDYVYDLCREALMRRTKDELIIQAQVDNELEDGEYE